MTLLGSQNQVGLFSLLLLYYLLKHASVRITILSYVSQLQVLKVDEETSVIQSKQIRKNLTIVLLFIEETDPMHICVWQKYVNI